MTAAADRSRAAWQRHMIAETGLAPTAVLVALVIAVYVDETGGQGVYMTAEELARLCHVQSVAVIRHHLWRLQELAWIKSDQNVRYLDWPTRFRRAPHMDSVIPHHSEPAEPFSPAASHRFVPAERPANGRPGPDRCLECGLPEALHTVAATAP